MSTLNNFLTLSIAAIIVYLIFVSSNQTSNIISGLSSGTSNIFATLQGR